MATERTSRKRNRYRVSRVWTGEDVRALRTHMKLTQEELSMRLGIRQQTISEWEVGKHQPRGASRTLLTVIAEQEGFKYSTSGPTSANQADRRDGV